MLVSSTVLNNVNLALWTLAKVHFIALSDMAPIFRLRVPLKHVFGPLNTEFGQFLVKIWFLGSNKCIDAL